METPAIDGTPECDESPEALLASPKSQQLHAEIRRHLAVVSSLKEAIGALHEYLEQNELDGDFQAHCASEFGIDADALFEATGRMV